MHRAAVLALIIALTAAVPALTGTAPGAEPDARWPYPETRVSYNSGADYTDNENQRNIVVDASGAIHAVWYNATAPYQIVYKRSTDNGATWTDSLLVSNFAPYNTANNRYPSLALDSAGTLYVVWSSAAAVSADRRILIRWRTSGGAWSSVAVLADSADNQWRSNPTITTTPDGRLHVAWLTRYYDPTFVNYYYLTCRERIGATWQNPVNLDSNTSQKAVPAIAGDRAGNLHLVWRELRTGTPTLYQVMYRKRTGSVWGSAVDLSQASYSLSVAVPSIAIDSIQPFVVFKATDTRLVLARDSAGFWLRDTLMPSSWSRYVYSPQVCRGPLGWMHVVYAGPSDARPDYQQIRYGTWTPSDRWTGFEDATAINSTSRNCPSLFVDNTGNLHLLWYDGRDGNNEIYYKRGLPPFANDISVVALNNVGLFTARGSSLAIGATVRNEGTAARSPGIRVILNISGPGAYSYADTVLTTQTLLKGQTQTLTFTPNWTAPNQKGPYRFTLRSELSGDQDPSNDTLSRESYVYTGSYETFTSSTFPPTGWDTSRLAGSSGPLWQRTTTAPGFYTSPAAAQFRSASLPAGNVGALVSPRLDLTLDNTDSLIFFLQHLSNSGQARDSLIVEASTNLGSSWTTLGICTGVDSPYSRKAYNLENLTQTTQCLIRFVGRSRNDQNINIDDIIAPAGYVPFVDVGMIGTYALSSYPLTAGSAETVAVTVRNLGRNAVGAFTVYAQLDSAVVGSAQVSGLAVNESRLVSVPVSVSGSERRVLFRFWHNLAGDEVRVNDTIAGLDEWLFPEGVWQANGFEWSTTWPPAGWDTANADAGGYCWARDNSSGYAHAGRWHARSRWESSTLRNNDWLIGPSCQPSSATADSFGLYWRAYSQTYPESIEVWLMSGRTARDTIARLYARADTSRNWLGVRFSLDRWDNSPVRVGIRNCGLDMYYLMVDDIWWRQMPVQPDTPALALPPDGATRQPVAGQLVWHRSLNTAGYRVLLDTVNPPVAVVADSSTDTVFCYSGLTPERSYWWQIVATNANGTARSPVWTFRTSSGSAPTPAVWREVAAVPLVPSGRAVKDGAWLVYDRPTGLIYVQKGNKTQELFAYSPTDSGWVGSHQQLPVGSEGKPPAKGAAATTDGNGRIFALKGNNTSGFWCYFTVGDSWLQLADVPLGPSGKRVKGGADLVYVAGDSGYVYLLKGQQCEFYRYNVIANRWDALPDAPAGARPKWDKGSWLVADCAGGIYAHKAKIHELCRYDIAAGTWGPILPGMPMFNSRTGKQKKAKDGSDAVMVRGSIYAIKGGNTQDCYRYELATGAWTECETVPSISRSGTRKKVSAGASLTATDDWQAPIFALKGNKTTELWRYYFGTTQPATRPPRSGILANASPASHGIRLSTGFFVTGRATLHWSLPSAGPARLQVFDPAGRVVIQRQAVLPASGSMPLNTAGLAAGVYTIRLAAANRIWSARVIVQR